MQTFLPYSDFHLTASCLDNKRLGKQRVEVLQILKAIFDGGTWQDHPAVNMWHGYENALVIYGVIICEEWKTRGFQDSCLLKILDYMDYDAGINDPPWLDDERLHSSHRAALLFKKYNYYKQFNWTEEPKQEYWWPSDQSV